MERVLDTAKAGESGIQQFQQFRLMLAFAKGESGEASRILEERIKTDPKDFAAYIQLGDLSLFKNDVAEAEHHLAQAMQIAPDAPSGPQCQGPPAYQQAGVRAGPATLRPADR